MASGLRIYAVTITGVQPLLLHADDIDWADKMEAWMVDKDNKKNTRAGDDRTPAHRWMGCLYHDEAGRVVLPTDNIMRVLMEGGAGFLVGKGRKTFKEQSQSGIMPRATEAGGWPLLGADGGAVSYTALRPLLSEPDFAKHKEFVETQGFRLYLKRARIGTSKHIRVRPCFDVWSAAGELVVTDDQITTKVLNDILEFAGKYKGLGDWRPSSKTPGTFGLFTAAARQTS